MRRWSIWASYRDVEGRGLAETYHALLEAPSREEALTLAVTAQARTWLAEHGFDPEMGARPMTRVIQDRIKRRLADELLFGALVEGGRVQVDVRDGQLVVDVLSEASAPAVQPAEA